MHKENIFYAALLLMAIGAEAKEIKGKVMADGKGLAKVCLLYTSTAGYFLFTNLAKKKAYRSPHY